MQVIFYFIFIILLQSYSFASDCKAVQWPYSKKVKNLQPIDLQTVKREYLYNFLYFELSSPVSKRTLDLGAKLLIYLKNTEQNNDRYQMILALEWIADLKSKNPTTIPLSEICLMESKIDRQPSSDKIKKKNKK